MSLHPQPIPPIPEMTVRVAKRAFRKGNIYLTIGDEIGTIFDNADFTELYAKEGKPALPPAQLALVLIFQYMEDLSDREAADAVRARIDWKYALHLPLEDEGFDFSVLSEFRERLLEHEKAKEMFARILAKLASLHLLKRGGKQRTDATHVLTASRRLSRLEMVRETMRMALEAVAAVAPEWLQAHAREEWYMRYRHHWNSSRIPKGEKKREQLLLTIAEDGYDLLEKLGHEGTPTELAELAAVQVLRQVWEQQFHRGEDGLRLRAAKERPAAPEVVVTPHDPEARRSTHGDHEWHGYRVHWTETCDENKPHLITDVRVTPATTPDVKVTNEIQADLAQRQQLPAKHLVDAGYVAGHVLEKSQQHFGVDLIGPAPKDTSWQARMAGFTLEQFQIDWEGQYALCPQGQRSKTWSSSTDTFGQAVVHIQFDKVTCQSCPVRMRCTRSQQTGRALKVRPSYETLRKARLRQKTEAYRKMYHLRAGVEGLISVSTRYHGMRRARYIGQEKTALQAFLTAMAINLRRAALWLMGERPAHTRPEPLAFIAPLPA